MDSLKKTIFARSPTRRGATDLLNPEWNEKATFCYRRCIHEGNMQQAFTCLITARKGDSDKKWSDAARAVRHFLRGKAVNGIAVEIIDPRLYQGLALSSCTHEDAIYHVRSEVLHQILEKIGFERHEFGEPFPVQGHTR
ncbi:hypothetical protein BDV25DRAFT_140764 [Aspergillus avenaceus]|uniref:Uncharacterized protein n=1 Tax=Aspergillus avenaceus TaxID=36643 RepID=A0A5N6TT08_ASPAV|nr:hypothetical protein BDV25DRAFT_140764 [Aspergillus avenaceus]